MNVEYLTVEQKSGLQMLSRSQILILILCFLIGLVSSNWLSAQENGSKPGIKGQQAPEWAVSQWHQLPDGKEALNIGDYKGKVLYLYFFQSWCPGCHKRGFPVVKKLYEKYKDDKQVEFVVIQSTFEGHSTNTAAKLKPVAAKYKLPIPFGQSRGSRGTPEIMQKYRTGGTPWSVIIDKQGKVQFNDYFITADNASSIIDGLKK